jgi:Flp pilus assembly protein TadG
VSRTRRGDRGQATVELALVLPLVAALLLVLLQVGLVVRDRVLVTHAAREAARAAAVADHDRSIAAERGAVRSSDLTAEHLHVTTSPVDGGDAVEVHVAYRSTTEVPLVGLLVPDLDLEADATMRVERPTDP